MPAAVLDTGAQTVQCPCALARLSFQTFLRALRLRLQDPHGISSKKPPAAPALPFSGPARVTQQLPVPGPGRGAHRDEAAVLLAWPPWAPVQRLVNSCAWNRGMHRCTDQRTDRWMDSGMEFAGVEGTDWEVGGGRGLGAGNVPGEVRGARMGSLLPVPRKDISVLDNNGHRRVGMRRARGAVTDLGFAS